MDYVAGYRCPVCGGKIYGKHFKENILVGVSCSIPCSWEGKLENCEKLGKEQFHFEKFMEQQEKRFHDIQFSEEDIAFSAFLEGMEYQRKIEQ